MNAKCWKLGVFLLWTNNLAFLTLTILFGVVEMRLSNAIVSKSPMTWVRLVASLALTVFSYLCQLPLIVFVALLWCVWLWCVRPNWKERRLAAFALVLTGFGWWVVKLDKVFGAKEMATHVEAEKVQWMNMIHASLFGGIGFMSLGLMLLAGIDFWGRIKTSSGIATDSQAETSAGQVWPPAPKRPQ